MGQKIELDEDLPDARYGFKCPGCKGYHQIPTKGSNAWAWNGSVETPTFAPSILVRSVRPPTEEEHVRIMAGERVDLKQQVCHSFVSNGLIQFLGDCTHDLASQTVELFDIPEKQSALVDPIVYTTCQECGLVSGEGTFHTLDCSKGNS